MHRPRPCLVPRRHLQFSPIRILTVLCLAMTAGPVFARQSGERTLEPLRVEQAPEVDGFLTDPAWKNAPVVGDFVQQRPDEGQPSSAETEVRVVYTSEALYVGFVCHEPLEVFHKILGRDAWLSDDDYFVVVLDPFHDRQNGVFFQVNPNGARTDEEFRGEGNLRNRDWDGIWKAATRITVDGWQGEIEIPWRTLRFPHGQEIAMGLNFERQRRVVNEQSHWSAVPRQFSVFRVSNAGVLSPLRGIQASRNLQFRPYALTRVERGDGAVAGSFDRQDWKGSVEVGGDLKVSLSSDYTLDLTVNTDFAEVEVDDELVNLTRFPLFYPEKREFFLEKANLFDFGSPTNQLFYSRTIGLRGLGRVVPIDYGARLTGKSRRTEVGGLFIQEGGHDGRRFTVLRTKQDLGDRSSVGAMFVSRDADAESFSRSYGIDADLNPTDRLLVSGYAAITDDQGPSTDAQAWGARARWSHRLTVLTLLHESLGSNFRPAAGFVQRPEIDDTAVGWEFTPEPNWPWIRRFENQGFFEWVRRRHVDLESRFIHVNPVVVGPSEQRLSFFFERDYERLFEEFEPSDQSEVIFPVGEYTFDYFGLSMESDPSRVWSGSVETEFGEFYDGDRTTLRVNGRFLAAPHWTVSAAFESNHVERTSEAGASQELDLSVVRARVAWDWNNQFGLKLFTQWNEGRHNFLSQMRAHWIFGDESDVYFVITDQREDGTRNFAPRRGEWVLKLGYARAW